MCICMTVCKYVSIYIYMCVGIYVHVYMCFRNFEFFKNIQEIKK
jgi:hypothetical protein